MAVVRTEEIHNGRDGEWESNDNQSVRRYTRVYRVKTDTNTDQHTVVVASVPQIGAVYPTDTNARCRRVRAHNESFSKLVWLVTCHYSTGREVEENPLNDPAAIEWVTETYQKIYVRDIDGDWICTTAGELFDPPPEGDDARWTVRVRKNVAVVPAWILTYRNSVNNAVFALDGISLAARVAKLSAIRISEEQQRNDIAFRVFEMNFHLNEETHDKFIENAGFYEKADTNAGGSDGGGSCGSAGAGIEGRRPILIYDPTNNKRVHTKKPWPLNEAGRAIDCPTPTNIVFNRYRIYPEKDFSVLPVT